MQKPIQNHRQETHRTENKLIFYYKHQSPRSIKIHEQHVLNKLQIIDKLHLKGLYIQLMLEISPIKLELGQ